VNTKVFSEKRKLVHIDIMQISRVIGIEMWKYRLQYTSNQNDFYFILGNHFGCLSSTMKVRLP